MMTRTMQSVLLGILLMVPAGARAQTEQVTYYHTDAIGSVRMTTNAAGAVIARYDYLPFGEPWDPPTNPDVRRFAGKERDSESGLDYVGARYYASQTGRFTSVDPAYIESENLVDPQRWNRYVYARNNPLRYKDPDGRLLDTILDVVFTAYDVFDLGRSIYRGEGVSGPQVGALAADVAGIFIPFATGGGAAVRAAARADDVAHLAKTAESASSFGKRGVDFIVTEAARRSPFRRERPARSL